jgi:hypothetical protein
VRSRFITLAALTLTLNACSYGYDLLATLRGGQVVFLVDPKSSNTPSCVRRIEVYDLAKRETVWRESLDYDNDCANKFPIIYGQIFEGQRQPEWPTIEAKELRPGVTYEISTTTGATGYGGGLFHIDGSGHVVNGKGPDESVPSARL